jgi:hypothetical protein
MTDHNGNSEGFDAPAKVYPSYHFQRRIGKDEEMRVQIKVDGQEIGIYDLAALDMEVLDPENDANMKFIFREATEFLIEERR